MSEPSRDEAVAAIRALAQWIEDHPEAPAPTSVDAQHSLLTKDDANADTVQEVARALGVPLQINAESAYLNVRIRTEQPYVSYSVHGFLGGAR